MSDVENLVEQFRRSFVEDCWAGPTVLQVMEQVTAEMAKAKPVANVHSIWELTLHMATWMDVGRWRVEHNEHVPTDDENFPPVTDSTDAAWEKARQTLRDAYDNLVDAIEEMTDGQLQEQIPEGGGLTHLVRLHGVIQHNMYHAGQINLMKRAQGWEYKPED
jgi:uncharacterized damage-inducible protein DinB